MVTFPINIFSSSLKTVQLMCYIMLFINYSFISTHLIGTCSYGGTVYQVGAGFQCLDGTNRCNCGAKNGVTTTLIAISPGSMCLKTTP